MRLFVLIVLIAGSMAFSGCGMIIVARSQQYGGPAYCSDCHRWQATPAIYTRCGYYEIRLGRHGYYYRPYNQGHHGEYAFAKFNFSDDKNTRVKHNEKSNAGEKPDTKKGARR